MRPLDNPKRKPDNQQGVPKRQKLEFLTVSPEEYHAWAEGEKKEAHKKSAYIALRECTSEHLKYLRTCLEVLMDQNENKGDNSYLVIEIGVKACDTLLNHTGDKNFKPSKYDVIPSAAILAEIAKNKKVPAFTKYIAENIGDMTLDELRTYLPPNVRTSQPKPSEAVLASSSQDEVPSSSAAETQPRLDKDKVSGSQEIDPSNLDPSDEESDTSVSSLVLKQIDHTTTTKILNSLDSFTTNNSGVYSNPDLLKSVNNLRASLRNLRRYQQEKKRLVHFGEKEAIKVMRECITTCKELLPAAQGSANIQNFLNIVSDQTKAKAKAKGQDRIRQADLLKQRDIEKYKTSIEKDYRNRYETYIPSNDNGTNYDIYTHVRGYLEKHYCYGNQLEYDNVENIWTFYGIANDERRLLDNEMYSEEKYPLGCGRFDNEVTYEKTQALPNECIIWNQVREAKEHIKAMGEEMKSMGEGRVVEVKKYFNSDISPYIYNERDIINIKDKNIIDALMPEEPSEEPSGEVKTVEMTFSKEDDRYSIILGTDSGRAKLKLGVLFGKSISSITIEKKLDDLSEIAYSIKYRYEIESQNSGQPGPSQSRQR